MDNQNAALDCLETDSVKDTLSRLALERLHKRAVDYSFVGDLAELKNTIKELGEDFDIHTENDLLLREASVQGMLPIVKYLLTSHDLKEHADVTAQNFSAFLAPCRSGNEKILHFFLTHNQTNRHSQKVLIDLGGLEHLAAAGNFEAIYDVVFHKKRLWVIPKDTALSCARKALKYLHTATAAFFLTAAPHGTRMISDQAAAAFFVEWARKQSIHEVALNEVFAFFSENLRCLVAEALRTGPLEKNLGGLLDLYIKKSEIKKASLEGRKQRNSKPTKTRYL